MLEKLQRPCFQLILINHEITYDAVMKSSDVGGGGRKMQAHTLKFWFSENLGNILDNPRKHGAQRCLTSKNRAQGLQKKIWKPFLEATPKKVVWFLWRKFVGKSCTKHFSAKFGEIRAKILRNFKNVPDPKLMMKRHLRPRCSSFERTGGWMPPPCLHLPSSLCILFHTHSVYSVTL